MTKTSQVPEHVRISMADGVRLSAVLYLPQGRGPWPAVFEALPYRKDDVTSSQRFEYARLAEAGYAACRVDVRGTGSSEGLATDEYPLIERTDLITVIEWLASQPWSTGAVGMYGTSYSGFNSIQVAMERPPALKAIIPIFATDDRFGDDVHYMGGIRKGIDTIDYPAYMAAMNALPPTPAIFGEGWREEWLRRIEENEPWIATWLEHQRLDDYWKAGSLRFDYGSIEAATMIVAGWADGYRNNSLRSFEALQCPKRLIAGPWSHNWPDTSLPGPNHDLLPEHIRWWDRWLKGIENGVDQEPPIVLYAQRSTPPDPKRAIVQGEWRYEPTWPAERLAPRELPLADAVEGAGAEDALGVRGDTGWTAWISCAADLPWGQPDDQRPDEAFSLVSTWPALDDELEILGQPRLRVRVASSVPVAYLSAKLCDVAPDGSSNLVTRGLLNLTHRNSREGPAPLEPGRWETIELELETMSWTFEVGHRIRLDLAGSDWPNTWPPPEPVTLTFDRASAMLTLPVLDGPSPVTERPVLPPPFPGLTAPAPEWEPPDDALGDSVTYSVTRDMLANEARADAGGISDSPSAPGDVPGRSERYGGSLHVSLDDPGNARAAAQTRFILRYPDATCEVASDLSLVSDRDTYRLRIDLIASEDGHEVGRRTWDRTFPRDLG
jgi:predicted acyl esterase